MSLKLQRLRARDQVRQALREAIVSGRFRGGQRLDEIRLAGELGVSRTPLREALIGLEEEGLVRSRPNHGFVVDETDERLVRELYPILAALEAAAVELGGKALKDSTPQLRELNRAIMRTDSSVRRYAADRDFHRALTAPCGNERLLQLLEQHWTHARRVDGGERRGLANRDGSCAEHAAIIDFIEKGKLRQAATLLRAHWLAGIDVVAKWMKDPR